MTWTLPLPSVEGMISALPRRPGERSFWTRLAGMYAQTSQKADDQRRLISGELLLTASTVYGYPYTNCFLLLVGHLAMNDQVRFRQLSSSISTPPFSTSSILSIGNRAAVPMSSLSRRWS